MTPSASHAGPSADGELDPYNAISCLTAFDDADEDNGCIWIVPASHKLGQLASITKEEKAAGKSMEVEADEAAAIPVPMRAGDVLLMHCHTLHRCAPPRCSNRRRAEQPSPAADSAAPRRGAAGGNASGRDRRLLFLLYADADAVEVFNDRAPRLGRLVRGTSRFAEVTAFEADLDAAISSES